MKPVIELLKSLGCTTVPESWYQNVELWRAWYRGEVRGFHDYTVFNGLRHVRCRKLTAALAKIVCENWADLLMNDKVHITLEGEAEQQFFDQVCDRNSFFRLMNLWQEYCFALGTVAIVARVSGLEVSEEGRQTAPATDLVFDYVPADGIFPLSWENGSVRECAFATSRTCSGRPYLYLQIHRQNPNRLYVIENHLYLAENEHYQEVDPETVPDFSGMVPVFHTGSDRPFYILDSPNIANNLAPDIPLGVSVFANALDQLKACDNIFDSLNSEFVLGRKRIMVKPEAVRTTEGEPLFDPNDLVFYVLPEDSQNGSTVREIDSALRVDEHLTGLQVALNALSMKCGFGANHWSLEEGGRIVTATQIISANSEAYRTQKKHELVLRKVLADLAGIVLRIGRSFFSLPLNEDVEISVDFDESVIQDRNGDFERDLKMLDHGILSPAEFRARWLNEDIATAAAALPTTPAK